MKKIIYTAMIGDVDLLRDPVIYNDSIDYVCFSDRPHPESKIWKVRKNIGGVLGDNRRRSRLFKACPHRFLQEYDASLYIDANMEVLAIPDFKEILGNSKISVKIHDRRNNIGDEANICIGALLDSKDRIANQIEIYQKFGIDVNKTNLYDCGAIFRYHNDPEIIKAGECWWNHICQYSCRDQISFPVAYSGVEIKRLPPTKFEKIVKRYRHKRRAEAKLYGFMHVCTANQWKEIFTEQVQKIWESGLYDKVDTIYCGIVGDGNIDFMYDLQLEKFKLAYIHHDIAQFEFLTLEFLQDFCKRNYNSKVFYIHTKGISTYGRVHVPPSPARQKNIDDWRRYLEYYIIKNYKICVEELNICDLVGVNWRGEGSNSIITPQVGSHFSGNFWWAKASYLSSLGAVREGDQKRCNAEFWPGKGNGVVANLHGSDIDHYRNGWPLEKYQDELKVAYFKVKDGISEEIYYDEKKT